MIDSGIHGRLEQLVISPTGLQKLVLGVRLLEVGGHRVEVRIGVWQTGVLAELCKACGNFAKSAQLKLSRTGEQSSTKLPEHTMRAHHRVLNWSRPKSSLSPSASASPSGSWAPRERPRKPGSTVRLSKQNILLLRGKFDLPSVIGVLTGFTRTLSRWSCRGD